MIRKRTVCRLAAGLLAVWLPAAAASHRGVGLYTDQDFAVPFFNEDRDYTMGLAVEFFWEEVESYPLDPALARIAEWLGFHGREDDIIRSIMVGSTNYTPDDLASEDVVVGDRPYASVLYVANKRIRANDRSAAGVELQVGVLGSSVPGRIQRELHTAYREATGSDTPVDPRGWDHQISNGGEPTARLRFAYSHLWHAGGAGWRRWDLAYTTGVTVGYQTNASLALAGRVGALASPFWSLPFDPINRGNFLPSLGARELYLWGALRGRAVAYDALLQGQFRDSDLTYGSGDVERFVLEGAVGVTASWERFQVTFAVNAKSRELDTALTRGHHVWGGLYLVAAF